MRNMTQEEIQKEVRRLSKTQEWNHCYEFPGGIRTRETDINSPGYNLNKWKRLQVLAGDLRNKSVLDVGCSDGFFAVESANAGASYVLGIEIDPIRIERAIFASQVLKTKNVEFRVGDLYEIPDESKFDIVLALGMLHRVPDMDKMLRKMSQIGSTLVLEYKSYQRKGDCCWDGKKQTKLNSYNSLHKVPTDLYVQNRLREQGFRNFVVDQDSKSHLNFKRSICIAQK